MKIMATNVIFRTLLAGGITVLLSMLTGFGSPQIGLPAPAFAVRDSDGQMVTLADFDGRLVVLEWNSGACHPDNRLYDERALAVLREELAGSDVVWLTVVSAAPGKDGHMDPATANEMARSRGGPNGPILLDETGTMARAYDVHQIPHYFVIDVDGRLAYRGGLISVSQDGEQLPALARAITAARNGNSAQPGITPAEGCPVNY